MSGWWFSASASSPTRFTNASASTNDSSSNVRSSALSTSVQPSGVTAAVSTIVGDDGLHRGHPELDPRTRRAGRELVLESVFRPLSNLFVPVLRGPGRRRQPSSSRTRRPGSSPRSPSARGELIAAAVLLQLKTLLDNLDGQLARASGRVTLTGRYSTPMADLVVNAAVFAALGHVTGSPFLAAVAFVALTLVLAVDFNVTELYREQRGLSALPTRMHGGGSSTCSRAILVSSLYSTAVRAARARFACLRSPGVAGASRARLAYIRRRSRSTRSRTSGSRRNSSCSGSASLSACPERVPVVRARRASSRSSRCSSAPNGGDAGRLS